MLPDRAFDSPAYHTGNSEHLSQSQSPQHRTSRTPSSAIAKCRLDSQRRRYRAQPPGLIDDLRCRDRLTQTFRSRRQTGNTNGTSRCCRQREQKPRDLRTGKKTSRRSNLNLGANQRLEFDRRKGYAWLGYCYFSIRKSIASMSFKKVFHLPIDISWNL